MNETIYGPRPESRKERAITAMKLSVAELTRKLETAGMMTPEQFEMEIRLQLMWLACGVNELHEAERESEMVLKAMRKRGWLE